MAPEEKKLLQFSSNNIQFSLNEFLTNLKTLLLMSPMNVYNDVDSESSAFVIKPKSERDDILKTLRDTVIKKIDIIKQKNLVSENGGNLSEPHSKRQKTCLNNITDSVSDKDKTQLLLENINIKVGSYAAVAYSDCWYPGQIIAEEGDFLTVKFLHPSKVNDNVFRWPQTDDCSEVEKIFVFNTNFEILPIDSSGRTWHLTSYSNVKRSYEMYYSTYFE